jgi:WD40 repeat protein
MIFLIDDSKFIVTGCADCTIAFWNAETGRLILKFRLPFVVRHLKVTYCFVEMEYFFLVIIWK